MVPQAGRAEAPQHAAGAEEAALEGYDIDEDRVDAVRVGDQAPLQLGFDWLRIVMFDEPTIALKPAVLQEAIGKAREGLGGV